MKNLALLSVRAASSVALAGSLLLGQALPAAADAGPDICAAGHDPIGGVKELPLSGNPHSLVTQVATMWSKARDPLCALMTANPGTRNGWIAALESGGAYDQGVSFVRNGNLAVAAQLFADLVRSNPSDASALFNLALVHARQGLASQARDEFSRASNLARGALNTALVSKIDAQLKLLGP